MAVPMCGPGRGGGLEGQVGDQRGLLGVGERRATLTCAVVVLILFTRCQATRDAAVRARCSGTRSATCTPVTRVPPTLRPPVTCLTPPCVCPAARAGACTCVWLYSVACHATVSDNTWLWHLSSPC